MLLPYPSSHYIQEGDEKVVINKIVNDRMTITILKKWDKPNKNAKNSDIGEPKPPLFMFS